jgi:hypothetical protein
MSNDYERKPQIAAVRVIDVRAKDRTDHLPNIYQALPPHPTYPANRDVIR